MRPTQGAFQGVIHSKQFIAPPASSEYLKGFIVPLPTLHTSSS